MSSLDKLVGDNFQLGTLAQSIKAPRKPSLKETSLVRGRKRSRLSLQNSGCSSFSSNGATGQRFLSISLDKNLRGA